MALVVLIGASGSGKTTIARAIEHDHPDVRVFYFDRIGVPAPDAMLAEYGSGEAWQRAKTGDWMRRLAALPPTGQDVLFEGQTRLGFLADGVRDAGGFAYRPLLVDCDDRTRTARLSLDRQQPGLATREMMEWAAYLRHEAQAAGCEILDTTRRSLGQCTRHVMERLRGRQATG